MSTYMQATILKYASIKNYPSISAKKKKEQNHQVSDIEASPSYVSHTCNLLKGEANLYQLKSNL